MNKILLNIPSYITLAIQLFPMMQGPLIYAVGSTMVPSPIEISSG